MTEKQTLIDRAVIEQLTIEYQSLWLIDVKKQKLEIYKSNFSMAIKGSIEKASTMNYEEARRWYIEECILEEDRERILEKTALNVVLPRISTGIPYVLDYQRVDGENVNINQIFYASVSMEHNEVTHFIMGFRNVDSARKAEIDDLTGLYNRKAFIRNAERFVSREPDGTYDILLSDIVDFKQINESYGTKKGDEVLRWIGASFGSPLKDERIVGRYAGDQFVVLMKHERVESLMEADESMLLFNPDEKLNLPPLRVKFGVCRSLMHDASVTTACDYAHIALNSIKHEYGKMLAVYDENLKSDLETVRRIESNMHRALEEEQFKVYYQPKHDAKTGNLVGAEALIRWIHPEYGFMNPGEFIPIFEGNGFVKEVDGYVWQRTCKNIKRWDSMGLKAVPISVNASKLDFHIDNLVSHMNQAADEAGIDRDRLHVEVTESLMENNEQQLIKILNELRDSGYKIELDDFGSGFASINTLSALPIDIVKLDMSFVRQIQNDKRKKVLEACIRLGHELGYGTVSEGVETDEQLEILRGMDVDVIQGYYYSKPLPEAEFEEYLKAQA